ncbi:hypothetical protein CEXT_323531 [Caerostris extrusa]|uniref:Uncharacterized protein n=1 Tax=Caerostris extrusa TaxID=172846 RepID=A0AAV4S8T4_CAEEX|nr:hypothetical protein CEXT_323531 [Caerostris extrusa]
MYIESLDPKVERLYPSAAFPVSRKTPMISILIRWDIPSMFLFTVLRSVGSAASSTSTRRTHTCWSTRWGQVPPSARLLLAWEALADKQHRNFEEMPVMLKNVRYSKKLL